jgi:hypothetical protein
MCALSTLKSGAKKSDWTTPRATKDETPTRVNSISAKARFLTLRHHRAQHEHTFSILLNSDGPAFFRVRPQHTHKTEGSRFFSALLDLLPFIESGLVPEQILYCAQVKGRKSFTFAFRDENCGFTLNWMRDEMDGDCARTSNRSALENHQIILIPPDSFSTQTVMIVNWTGRLEARLRKCL